MPINESTRKPRERWPVEFDLEGVPRDSTIRQQLLEQKQQQFREQQEQPEMSSFARPQNFFAVDKPASQIPQVIDINNPNVPRYGSPQNPKLAYPKIVYHHESGRVLQVKNGPQFEAATRRGFVSQPSPDRDYHNVQSGQIAPIKAVGPEREHVMTAEELEQLEAQELASIGQGEAQSAEDADTEIAAQLGEAPEKPGKRKK